MPYISTAERLGKKEGLKEGLEKVAVRLLSKGEKPAYVKEITDYL